MGYKHDNLLARGHDLAHIDAKKQDAIQHKMTKTQVNLKLIPHVDGNLAIAQLVAYNLEDVTVKGAWSGPARLHLVPHVNAPVADLPVRKVMGGLHFVADLTLPFGRVAYDYIEKHGTRVIE
jgi:acetoacetate decarboxylase